VNGSSVYSTIRAEQVAGMRLVPSRLFAYACRKNRIGDSSVKENRALNVRPPWMGAITRGRAAWWNTIGAYLIIQVLVMLGSFARIPLMTLTIGAGGYGLVVAAQAAWALCGALSDGLSQTTRSVTAERVTIGRTIAGVRALATTAVFPYTLTLGAVGLALLSFDIAAMHKSPSGDEVVMTLAAVAIFVIAACIAQPLAPFRGAMEGLGRTATVNLAQGATVLIGLPAMWLLLRLNGTVAAAALATAIGLVSPYFLLALIGRRAIRVHDENVLVSDRETLMTRRAMRSGVLSMSAWTLANVLVYALDPAIVAAVNGTENAAAYGLASRVMTLAIFVPIALTGLVNQRIASWRARGDWQILRAGIIRATVGFSAIGCATSLVSIALGPYIAFRLGAGLVQTPTALYVWLGLFALVTTASSPLFAAFSGPSGARVRATTSAAMSVVNVVLSIFAAIRFGPSGPVAVSTICSLLMIFYLLKRVRNDRALLMEGFES
jgi:O-antigen/teichoic acid export membrane protein